MSAHFPASAPSAEAWSSVCKPGYDARHEHHYVIAVAGHERPVLVRAVLEPGPAAEAGPAVAAYWIGEDGREPSAELIAEYATLDAALRDLEPGKPAPEEPVCLAPDAHGYEIDDVVEYGPGPWPFHAWPGSFRRPGPDSVRFAPDTAYYAWRDQYVGLHPATDDPARATGTVSLFTVHGGRRAVADRTAIALDLERESVAVSPDCPAELRPQAHVRATRLLAAVLRHREARDAGRPLISAYHLHVAEEIEAGRWRWPLTDDVAAAVDQIQRDRRAQDQAARG